MELMLDIPAPLYDHLQTMADRLEQDAPELVLRLIKSYLSTAQDPVAEPQPPDDYFEQRLEGTIVGPELEGSVEAANLIDGDEAPAADSREAVKTVFDPALLLDEEGADEPLFLWLLGHNNSAHYIPSERLVRRILYATRG